jgi:hypothetical protein
VRIENQSSAGESVLWTISKAAATLFSVTITESTPAERQIQASAGEAVLVMIFKLEDTHYR